MAPEQKFIIKKV